MNHDSWMILKSNLRTLLFTNYSAAEKSGDMVAMNRIRIIMAKEYMNHEDMIGCKHTENLNIRYFIIHMLINSSLPADVM